MSETSPIFILGAPRSGTTLLRLVLDAHPHISAGPETRFLLDLARIFGQHWDRLERFGFDRTYWREKVATFFASVHADYAAARGKRRWCEKTPRYTVIADLIAELYPDARFLHVVRDGLDVVASHRDRWGWRSAYAAIDDWRTLVRKARRFGAEVGPERYLEVRYESLVADAEPTLREVFRFLDEPWDDAVLHFDDGAHDAPTKYEEHTRRRREEAGTDGPIYASRIGAGARELDPFLRYRFRRRAGKLRRELGYS